MFIDLGFCPVDPNQTKKARLDGASAHVKGAGLLNRPLEM